MPHCSLTSTSLVKWLSTGGLDEAVHSRGIWPARQYHRQAARRLVCCCGTVHAQRTQLRVPQRLWPPHTVLYLVTY